MKGKYIIAWDTLCEGHQCDPTLYDSYDDAFREIFVDASCGIEGNEDYGDAFIEEMNQIIKDGDVQKMKDFFDRHPDANYYEEFIEKAEDFILGRKAIFTGDGIVIEGTKLFKQNK